jgi:hypothetical protein
VDIFSTKGMLTAVCPCGKLKVWDLDKVATDVDILSGHPSDGTAFVLNNAFDRQNCMVDQQMRAPGKVARSRPYENVDKGGSAADTLHDSSCSFQCNNAYVSTSLNWQSVSLYNNN